MIILPEVEPDYKTMVHFTNGSGIFRFIFVLLRMKEFYGSLDNVVPLYFPYLLYLDNNKTYDQRRLDLFDTILKNDHKIFTDICDHFGMERRLEFLKKEDFEFENKDSFIDDIQRMDFYPKCVELAIEKNMQFDDIVTITSCALDPNLNEVEIPKEREGRIFYPLKNKTNEEIYFSFRDDEKQYLDMAFSKCSIGYPYECNDFNICPTCEMRHYLETLSST